MTGSLASPLSPGSSAPEKWRGTEGRKDISEKLYRGSWNKSLVEINMYVCVYIINIYIYILHIYIYIELVDWKRTPTQSTWTIQVDRHWNHRSRCFISQKKHWLSFCIWVVSCDILIFFEKNNCHVFNLKVLLRICHGRSLTGQNIKILRSNRCVACWGCKLRHGFTGVRSTQERETEAFSSHQDGPWIDL